MYSITEKDNGNIVIHSDKEDKSIEIRPDMTVIFSDKENQEGGE